MNTIRHATNLGAAALILAGTALAASVGADAGTRNRTGYVIAESEFGNGTITALVRRGRKGRQVRLPGGNWVYCGRSCSETLRLKTVDFWQSEEGAGGKDAITSEPGLLSRWLRWQRSY